MEREELERTNYCSTCHKSFRKPSLLLRHELTHREEKLFKCNECNKSFTQKASQQRHILHSHRKEKKHKCPECAQTFAQRANLDKHLARTHPANGKLHRQDLIQCPKCSCKFGQLNIFRRHLSMRHSNVQHNSEKEPNWSTEDGGAPEDPEALAQNVLNQLKYLASQLNAEPKAINASQTASHATSNVGNGHIVESRETHCPTLEMSGEACDKTKERLESVKLTSAVPKVDQKNADFLCEICGIGFTKRFNLIRHRAVHSEIGRFNCDTCARKFRRMSHLESHSQQHILHDQEGIISNVYSCYCCTQKFSSMAQFDAHMKDDHADTHDLRYMCLQCPATFASLSTFSKHQHKLDVVVSEANGPSESSMRRNKYEHGRRFFISKCSGPSSDVQESSEISQGQPNLLEVHSGQVALVDKHANENESSSRKKFLELQMFTQSKSPKRNIHVEIIKKDSPSMDAKICQFCQKEFKKPSDLKRHLPTHTKSRAFSCEKCNKSFAFKSTLIEHQRTHDVQRKTCTCLVCGKQYASKKVLNVHLRLHTGQRPFPCQYCDRKFRTSGHYIAHCKSSHTIDMHLQRQ